MQCIRSFAALVIFIFVSQTLATVIPSESPYTESLDGSWRFKLEQPGDIPQHPSITSKQMPIILPAHFEPFEKTFYREDSSWHDLKVPGNWEMYGFSPADYGQPDNAIGIYRTWVKVPADWKGRLVKLNFDGVQNGAEIYLNGQPVDVTEPAWGRKNYHEGGWDAFQADLTPAVKFGEKNLLAIRVYKNTKSVNMDTGDFFFLGGIHRDVTLFSVPQVHVDDYIVRTTLMDVGAAEVRVIVKLAGGSPQGGSVVMQLKGEAASVSANVGGQTSVELSQQLENARLWSAEKPNLYDMSLDLKDADGKVIEHIEKKIGVREVTIENGVFLVNNVPVKLAGICRHDVYPTMGTAVDESVWKKDITLMKACNINAIRTSHYPYGTKFYDLCDEMGMYAVDEMAACWVPTDTDELTPRFAQHAREVVGRDKNHPCVIIWAIGNENGKGKNNGVSADIMKQMDPTRPRLVSVHDSMELEGNVEFDDRHYPVPAEIEKLAAMTSRREVYPLILMENPNVWDERNGADYGDLDLWGEVMNRDWKDIWNDRHIPGSFLWEWQDRAIADPGPIHLYDYDPKTGINLAKVKGIVDGFRSPRADYYHVKMVYAPVVVDARASVGEGAVTLNINNRYSFTDLSDLKTTWRLLSGDKEIKTGNANLSLAPLKKENVQLVLPEESLSQADALQISFDAADGRNVATYQVALKKLPQPTLSLDKQNLNDVHFPHLNLVVASFGTGPIGWTAATRYSAHLENISVHSARSGAMSSTVDEAALDGMPLADVRSIDADVVLPTDMHVAPPKGKRRKKGAKANAAPAEATGGNVGHVHVDVMNGKFTYTLAWTGGSLDIQELGWAFAMPSRFDHFSWNRQALWSWYPSTHVGRPAGTAMPDSADQDVTKLTRPDAFDFNSTKYYCNFAKLTDASGNGLGVNFAANDREDCRGGIGADGYSLVVNRYCCPPRDLSGGVVPDLYFMIKANSQVEGAFALGWAGRP
jgi:beta-galactosidase